MDNITQIKRYMTALEPRRQNFSYLSKHAKIRIHQRTSMKPRELMHLLDQGGALYIGETVGFQKKHYLFYSPNDHFYYVAIQDKNSGKVITVWPIGYHKNSAWKITPEECEKAKQIYEHYASRKEKGLNKKIQKHQDITEVEQLTTYLEVTNYERFYKVVVQAIYISKEGTEKRKTLFKIQVGYYISNFEDSMKELLQREDIYKKIDKYIRKRRLFQEQVFAIVLSNKKSHTDFYWINLRCYLAANDYAQRLNRDFARMNSLLFPYTRSNLCIAAPAPLLLICCD